MKTDFAFMTGKTHRVCQDYAAAGPDHVILADGCSGSPDTDFGARLLTQSAKQHINDLDIKNIADKDRVHSHFQMGTILKASEMALFMGLPSQCLDATLLYVKAEGPNWIAVAIGDGVIAVGYMDGSIEVTDIEYTKNYPCYLNYEVDLKRSYAYTHKSQEIENELQVNAYTLLPDGTRFNHHVSEPMRDFPDSMWLRHKPKVGRFFKEGSTVNFADEVVWIAVMSDGVKAVMAPSSQGPATKRREPVGLDAVLRLLLGFKGFQGEFVQRRFQRFVEDAEKLGWQFDDDVSLAVLYRGDEMVPRETVCR
jgi:hypothetical protein